MTLRELIASAKQNNLDMDIPLLARNEDGDLAPLQYSIEQVLMVTYGSRIEYVEDETGFWHSVAGEYRGQPDSFQTISVLQLQTPPPEKITEVDDED